MTAMATSNDWNSLLSETQDLVAQDNYNFPKVDRSIPQLQQFAESLRSRTSKLRSLNNQIAATRLLAQQGFDASRLTQEVTSLDIQPTIEDVFHADVSSVEDYLRQVEESTILAALQEAEQQTVAAFDAHMEDCMTRDWAANKRQLYGLIAPHSGGGISSSTFQQPGQAPSAFGTPARPAAGVPGGPPPVQPALQLSASEQAYIDVIKQLQQAIAAGNASSFDLVNEFKAACKGDVTGGQETTMRSCWALLGDMLSEAKAKGLGPQARIKFLEALAAGARKHLERGHCQHMRNTVLRHKLRAERGADPDQLREVQAYVQVKLGGSSRSALDFQSPGGTDTSWIQVYFCLRNGWHDAARRAAERAHDVSLAKLGGEGGFRGVLDEWIRNGGKIPDRIANHLARTCETLMQDKAALKSQIRQPYLILVLALIAGDFKSVDALISTLNTLQLPSVLATIEDYMWCKLTLLQANKGREGGGRDTGSMSPSLLMGSSLTSQGGRSLEAYTLSRMQDDINRWPAAYYSKQGKEPLLYLTVLLLSLQFPQALRFLWQDDMARAYRTDAVHLAIALHREGILGGPVSEGEQAARSDPGPEIASIIHAYGRKFLHHDSTLALQYYMLAAQARGNSIAVKGQLLRELLTESRDFGTLLGGGSAGGGGALAVYVRDDEERKRLFEAVAYECQVAAQPEEAVELYLAAGKPRSALALLNAQLAAIMPAAVEEATTGITTTDAADKLKRVMTRARAAREAIGTSTDVGSRKEVEGYDALCTIWDLLLLARKGRHDLALQKLNELACIPLEKSRVELCSRAVTTTLHTAVQERLPDVLAAAADTIAAQKAGAERHKMYTLRQQLEALCQFANNISFRVPRSVYQKLSETAAGF